MNKSCFSLGFLFQNSLWKLSTFHGYKDLYIVGWERNVKSQFFPNKVVWRLDLATGLSCEFKPRANGLAGSFPKRWLIKFNLTSYYLGLNSNRFLSQKKKPATFLCTLFTQKIIVYVHYSLYI